MLLLEGFFIRTTWEKHKPKIALYDQVTRERQKKPKEFTEELYHIEEIKRAVERTQLWTQAYIHQILHAPQQDLYDWQTPWA
jgi:hypothetical protein